MPSGFIVLPVEKLAKEEEESKIESSDLQAYKPAEKTCAQLIHAIM